MHTNNPVGQLTEYELRHLPAHLESAGRDGDLHCLLVLETVEHSNAWYEARAAQGDITAYLADIQRAWQLATTQARDQNTDCKQAPAIALEIRYALMAASIHNVASNTLPLLIVAMVKQNVWSPVVGLAYILNIQDAFKRGRALAALLPVLPLAHQKEAFDAALMIEDRIIRVQVLVNMAPYLVEPALLRVLEEVQELWEEERIEALVALTPHLSEDLQEEVFEVAHKRFCNHSSRAKLQKFRALPEGEDRRQTFKALRQELPKPLRDQLIDYVLGYLNYESYEHCNDSALHDLLRGVVPYLPEKMLWQALLVTEQIRFWRDRTDAYVVLAPRLPESLLRKALTWYQERESNLERDQVLAVLLPRLAEIGFVDEALDTTRTIKDEECLLKATAGIVPSIAKTGSAQRALAITKGIKHAIYFAQALLNLAPHLPTSMLTQALELARQVRLGKERAQALVALLPFLNEETVPAVAEEALTAVREAKIFLHEDHYKLESNGVARALALADIAPRLSELGYADRVLATLEMIRRSPVESKETSLAEKVWAQTIVATGLHLSGVLLKDAYEAVQKFQTAAARALALSGFACKLPEEFLQKALADARSPEEIAVLAPFLPERLLKQVLTLAMDKFIDDVRPQILESVAPHLTIPLLAEAVASSQLMRDSYAQSPALARLAQHALNSVKATVLPQALEIAHNINRNDEGARLTNLQLLASYLDATTLKVAIAETETLKVETYRTLALQTLIPCLAKVGEPKHALQRASGLESESVKADVLSEMAKHLYYPLYIEVFAEIERFESDENKTKLIVSLAPYLPNDLLMQALDMAHTIQTGCFKVPALMSLAPRMSDHSREKLITVAWPLTQESLKEIPPQEFTADAVSSIAPYLSLKILQRALTIVEELEPKSTLRGTVLARLGPYLSEDMLRRALQIARKFDVYERKEAFVGLLPRLAEFGFIAEAMESLLSIDSLWDAEALAGIARYLPEARQHEVLQRLGWWNDRYGNKPRLIAELAPYLVDAVLMEALEVVLNVKNKFDRLQPIEILASRISAFRPEDLLSGWYRVLPLVSRRERSELLFDISALAPIITILGGMKAIEQIIESILNVGHWWH
jgi:hypothetical protein